MKDVNVLMVGVGGQGVILASDAVGEIGMNNGYDVKKSDSLGMAQRGGSVISHVRWGERIFSPMIKKGEVDFLLGFEQLEAARWSPYIKPGGVAIVSDVVIVPVSVIGSGLAYPQREEVKRILAQYAGEAYGSCAHRHWEERACQAPLCSRGHGSGAAGSYFFWSVSDPAGHSRRQIGKTWRACLTARS